MNEAEKVIREALRAKFSEENIVTKTILGAPKSASLRFRTTNAVEVEAIVQGLHKVSGRSAEEAQPLLLIVSVRVTSNCLTPM